MLESKYSNDFAFSIGESYAWRGEGDLAFSWLHRAYEDRDGSVVDMRLSLFYQQLAGDPRYKAFLKKMKLPE